MAQAHDAHWLPRSPRVPYSAQVRLSGAWSDREPCFVPLLAQSIDLSEHGMALVTALPVAPGSIVTCSLRIGGRQMYLVGKVVWARSDDGGLRRAGIRFEPPGEEDRAVVQRVLALGRTHPHRVSVRFEGRPDSMTALAQLTRSGIALTAPLPILKRHTAVRIAFTPGGHAISGHVDRVKLEDMHGMPALRVGIRLPEVHADEVAERGRADATPVSVEVAVAREEEKKKARVKEAVWVAGAVILLGVGWGMRATTSESASTSTPTTTSESASTPTSASTSTATPTPIATPVATAVAAPANEVAFKWRKARREVRVAFEGSAGGLRAYRVTEPPGIVVELPHASVGSAQKIAVHRPGVSRVDVEPWQEGGRVRVWLRAPVSSYRVDALKDGVKIVLPVER